MTPRGLLTSTSSCTLGLLPLPMPLPLGGVNGHRSGQDYILCLCVLDSETVKLSIHNTYSYKMLAADSIHQSPLQLHHPPSVIRFRSSSMSSSLNAKGQAPSDASHRPTSLIAHRPSPPRRSPASAAPALRHAKLATPRSATSPPPPSASLHNPRLRFIAESHWILRYLYAHGHGLKS